MRFSPSLIERLRAFFLMSEVVGRRMPIKKHGREYHGLCPFHNEKTASFTVNDEKSFFHCFGCGAHGDAIEFVRRFERIPYGEAVEKLAREAGISISEPSPEERKKVEQEKSLYDVTETACLWFEKQLMSPAGILAKDYAENRGISEETIRRFRIGYAPDDKAALHNYLTKAGISQAMQKETGLISVSDSGNVYDKFRGRLMFPIRNISGKVVAFGGRLLAANKTEKHLPKYLNSPETPLFKKGELLYNMDAAGRFARDAGTIVVTEGYMDTVMSVQNGIAYAVATLGTAVTPEHLRLLWRVVKEPIICLDGDAAGRRAMLRAAEVALPLLKPGYSLRYATLPQGEDPDSYVQKQGKIGFEKLLLSSRRLSQILWEVLLAEHRLDLPEGRAALDDACRKLADKISDSTVRGHYLAYFRSQLRAHTAPVFAGKKTEGKKAPQIRSPHIEQLIMQHHSTALQFSAQRLLAIAFNYPVLLHKSSVETVLSGLELSSAALNNLRSAMLAAAASCDVCDYEKFSVYINEQLGGESCAEIMRANYSSALGEDDILKLWAEALSVYENARLEHEFKEVQERIGRDMKEEDYERMLELQNAVAVARAKRTFAPAEAEAEG